MKLIRLINRTLRSGPDYVDAHRAVLCAECCMHTKLSQAYALVVGKAYATDLGVECVQRASE